MSPRALITGGAGFLGSHLCDRLVSDGWEVLAVDNLPAGRARNLRALSDHPSFSFKRLDVATDPLPDEAVDAVFHLACPASPVQYARLPLETLQVSSVGTHGALELAARHGAAL